jgi:LmbE family N-acetylglucosaminyl deacetylase
MKGSMTRRLLLGSTASATTSAAAPALPAESTVSASPDATLIAACEEFDRLEREYLALFDGPKAMADEDERDEAVVPIIEAQKPHWNVICSTQAKTLVPRHSGSDSLMTSG